MSSTLEFVYFFVIQLDVQMRMGRIMEVIFSFNKKNVLLEGDLHLYTL